MWATVTVKLKLDVTGQVSESLQSTQAAYVRALNLTSAVAFEKQIKNAVTLHHLTYRDCRAATALPSNLVCSARALVAEAYKRELGKLHRWKDNVGVRYDARTLTLKLETERATLTTLNGRVNVGLILSDYHRQYLDGSWNLATTATLVLRRGVWYLHLTATRDVPEAQGSNVMGMDAGIKRIATLSTGKVFKGGTISHLRHRRFRQRRSLQTKPEGQSKSRNQRRLLNRLSGSERRAVDWYLWNVANGIVREALRVDASVIAAENLKGIRDRIRVAKKQRIIHHGWPFSSLFAKIQHVGSKVGITFDGDTEAAYSSQECSKCHCIDRRNRKSQTEFCCISCSHRQNADINASFNIRDRCVLSRLGVVNSPLTSVVSLQGGDRAKAA